MPTTHDDRMRTGFSLPKRGGRAILFTIGMVVSFVVVATLGGTWYLSHNNSEIIKGETLAERQRARIQKIRALLLRAVSGGEEVRSELKATATRFDKTLARLRDGDKRDGVTAPPAQVRPRLGRVQEAWEPMRSRIRRIARASQGTRVSERAIANIRATGDGLVQQLKRVGQAYAMAQERRAETLLFIWGLFLVTLVGGGAVSWYQPHLFPFDVSSHFESGRKRTPMGDGWPIRNEGSDGSSGRYGLGRIIHRLTTPLVRLRGAVRALVGDGAVVSPLEGAASDPPREPSSREPPASKLSQTIAPIEERENAPTQRSAVSTPGDCDLTTSDRAAVSDPSHPLYEHLPMHTGIWEADLRDGHMYWSNKAYRIHECTPGKEMDMDEVLRFYAPEDRVTIRETFEMAVRDGEPFELELLFTTPEGRRRWIRMTGTPLEGEEDAVHRMAGSFQDLTQRRRVEKALREQGTRLCGLARSIPGVVYQYYARSAGRREFECGTYFVSNQAVDILGMDPDPQGFHRRFLQRIPSSHRDQYVTSLERAAEDGTRWRVEVPFEKSSGDRIWLLASAAPEKRDGELVFNGVFLDITARKEAEETLREREGVSRAIAQNVSEGLYRTTPDDGIVYTNQAFAEMLGYDSEEILGVDPADLYATPEDRESLKRAADEQDAFDGVEVRFRRKDGSTFLGYVSGTVVRDEKGNVSCYDGAVTDISDQKDVERALREERDRLETLFESLPTPVVRCTVQDEGTFIADANGAFEEVFGLDSGSVEGQNANALLLTGERLPDDVFYESERIEEHLLENTSLQTEVRRQTAAGPRDFHLQAAGRKPTDGPAELYAIYTDITDEKRYQHELERLATRLELALEATKTGVWEWDLTTDEVFWGEASERLFGYEPGTFPGTSEAFWNRVLDDDRETVKREVRRAVKTGDRLQTDFRIQVPGEEARWIESRGVVQYDEDGEAHRMIGIQTDVTERKKRERDLRRKERRYQAILEDPNILAGLLAPDGTLLQANQTALSYIEPDLEDVTGRPVWHTSWWEAEEKSMIREKVERAAAGNYVEFEATHTSPDGSEHLVAGTIRPVTDREGRVVSLVVSSRNITQRKRREREARRRADAMEATSAGIAILDADGTYNYANQAHADIYGFESPDVLLGNTWEICYGEAEVRRFKEEIMPTLLKQGRWQGQVTGQRVDGTPFPEALTLTTLEDGGVICIVRDITQQKEKERKLRRAKEDAEHAQREAEEANRIKSAFLANMSHEIRTPLTSIIGFAEAIDDELPSTSNGDVAGDLSTVERFAGSIKESGHRLMETLTDVLNLSKLEAGEMQFSPERTNVVAKAREVVEEFRAEANEVDVDLHLEEGQSSVWHPIDPKGVRIVLRNLISNAIKYTEAGGEVQLLVYKDGDAVVVEVEDTGIGMEPEHVPEVFEPFRQASEGLAREYQGTGLGLTVTKQVVSQMGGTIDVNTEKGRGSCFVVRFE